MSTVNAAKGKQGGRSNVQTGIKRTSPSKVELPDTLELFVLGASSNENAYNRLETHKDFAYNSKKDGDLNVITGVRADTCDLVVVEFQSASVLKHFLQDKSTGALIRVTGVRSVAAPDNFDAYYAIKFDGQCTIISSSTEYNLLPPSMPRCPASQFHELEAVADKKKRVTKVLVGVIDEAPIGGEGERPVKVKVFVLDGKKWLWVNYWTPAAKRSIACICAAALPVIVGVTITMSRSTYGSRDIQADVNAPHMPYKLKRDSTCGSYYYRKATAIFPTVADGTLQDGSYQLCAIVDGDQELSIDSKSMFIPLKCSTPAGGSFGRAVVTKPAVFDNMFAPLLEVAGPVKEIIKGTIPVEEVYAVRILGKFQVEVKIVNDNEKVMEVVGFEPMHDADDAVPRKATAISHAWTAKFLARQKTCAAAQLFHKDPCSTSIIAAHIAALQRPCHNSMRTCLPPGLAPATVRICIAGNIDVA